MLSDLHRLRDDRVRRLVALADGIGTLHPGEARAVAQVFPERADAIVPIDLALNLNRSATEQGLFGVGWFGRFVVAIRRFPAEGPRFERSVTHEILRSALTDISVAEVDGTRWRITDAENTVELPVNPTRVNLWRLMAHGLATVDLRPPGPFGRESIESMLLGTPVVVPDGSAAMEHVAAASGGLWYRDAGELLDAVRIVVSDEALRRQLGHQGQTYATAHHGDMSDFVARTNNLVRGRAGVARAPR
jgi:glycosyltransferase involved in cell wall biosynthesis